MVVNHQSHSDHELPTTAPQYVQWVFSPHVGVLCDEEAQNSCLKNGLKFMDLLQPFCTLQDDVGISDPNGTLVTVSKLRLVLQDINVKPPSAAMAKKMLNHVVTTAANNALPSEVGSITGSDFTDASSTVWYDQWRESFHLLQHPADHEFVKHLIACIIVVSSSHGERANEEVQALSKQQHQQQHQPLSGAGGATGAKFPKWFSPNILKYYLVLHDASTTPKQVGDAAYQAVHSSCGGNCHILTINSGRPPGVAPLPQYWVPHTLLHTAMPGYSSSSASGSVDSSTCSSPGSPMDSRSVDQNSTPASPPHLPHTPPSDDLSDAPPCPLTQQHPLSPTLPSMEAVDSEMVVNTCDQLLITPPSAGGVEWGCCLSIGDIDNMRQFIGSFVRGALVPHVERQVRHLTEVVTNRSRSKSLLSATRRWLGGNKAPSSGSSANSVLYSSEATELQTRRLADLAFMFCMYDVAHHHYQTAKNDFKGDQAWLYFAGAQEMAALSLFMQNYADFPRRYLENTWDTLSSVCKATNLGMRVIMVACEVLKHNKCYSEAAIYYIKLTSEESDLLSALMLEQAASCYMLARQVVTSSFRRKFAFHMTLAAHRYTKASQKKLSLRANLLANQVYGQKGLNLAEDHILYCVGKTSAQLKAYGAAIETYTHLVNVSNRLNCSSKQSPQQQLAYFREFLALYKLIENNHERVKAVDAGLTQNSATGTIIEGPLPELPELPVPCFNAQQSMLLIDASVLEQGDNTTINQEGNVFKASGTTFTNCLPEHDQCWLGLQRLILEEVFKVFTRPAPLPLYSPDSDNSRAPELPVNEYCCLQIPVTNPFAVGITISDVNLKYCFTPADSQTTAVDQEVVNKTVIPIIELEPNETKSLGFNLCPSVLGTIKVSAVNFKLCLTPERTNGGTPIDLSSAYNTLPIISGYQNISVKGPRLNKNLKDRNSVSYGLDKRLEVTAVAPLPKVDVKFSAMPSRLHCGQICAVKVTIINIGTLPISDLYLAISDPKHAYYIPEGEQAPINNLSSNKHSNECDSFDLIGDNGETKAKQKRRVNKLFPRQSTASSLCVGESITGTLYIKGQQVPGEQPLLLVFCSCHTHPPPADDCSIDNKPKKQNKSYRMLRHQSIITVRPSINIQASAFSSILFPSPPPTKQFSNTPSAESEPSSVIDNVANVSVEVSVPDQLQALDHDATTTQTFTVIGVSGYSRRWKLKSLSSHHNNILSPSESLKIILQCEALGDNSSSFPIFSFINFADGCSSDITTEAENSFQTFAKLSQLSLSALTAVAPMPAPAADCEAPAVHSALQQLTHIKNSDLLNMVLTVHWGILQQPSTPSCTAVFGQQSLLLKRIGDIERIGIMLAVVPQAQPSQQHPSYPATVAPVIVPARIIPPEAPTLPQIPTEFATSCGVDMCRGDGGTDSRVEGCLTVAQATALYKDGVVDVSDNLSIGQLENCVRVSAEYESSITHDFSANKLCHMKINIVVHNTTSCGLTGLLAVVNRSKQSPPTESSIAQPPPSMTVSNTLRYVGCVARSLTLDAKSQTCVPCTCVVPASGTYTLGTINLSLKSKDGVKLVRKVVLQDTITVYNKPTS